MSFWNYIGEFFLFRWLFGTHKPYVAKHNVRDTHTRSVYNDITDDWDSCIDHGSHYDNGYSRYEDQEYGYLQSYDDFHDEQDDYDMMDDDF